MCSLQHLLNLGRLIIHGYFFIQETLENPSSKQHLDEMEKNICSCFLTCAGEMLKSCF